MLNREYLLFLYAMKKFYIQFPLLLLLMILASCEKDRYSFQNLEDFIPEGSSMVFKISDWQTFQSDIENNSFLKNYNDSEPFASLIENKVFFTHLHPSGESLLSIQKSSDSTSNFTFISKNGENIFLLDSIKNKKEEILKVNNQTYKRLSIDKNPVYLTTTDSIFVVSSSQQIISELLDKKAERNPEFLKLYKLGNNEAYSIIYRDSKSNSWSQNSVNLTQESISLRGIQISSDSLSPFLTVFKDQQPQENRVAEITPTNALAFISLTFNDSEKLQNNISKLKKEKATAKKTGIFDSANEVGFVRTDQGEFYFLNSIDVVTTNDALAQFISSESNFREIEIKQFEEGNLIGNTFAPLLPNFEVKYVFELDNFFVFTKTLAQSEDIIGAYLNKSTLKNSAAYEQMTSRISSAASFLTATLNGIHPKTFDRFLLPVLYDSIPKQKEISEHPLSIKQFIADKNFAHIAFHSQQIGKSTLKASGEVTEIFHTKLKAPILGTPLIIDNNGPQVVVQDAENTLHYLSETGKSLWTKELGKPIIGAIQTVDLFKNGNKQIAFATENRFYVLDRNGKDLRGFPLRFKDAITQPLAVFDYDNNHNYRFVLIQDSGILLYDNQGAQVKGFTFRKAGSSIVQPPVHIRMGNKDYILIPERNGKLNILNRQGRTRVNAKKSFEFSEIPIVQEDNFFVVIDKNNAKHRISDKGEVSSQNLEVGENYWFTTLGNTKATLDDNLLRVNGKLIDLPLGVYSRPLLFLSGNKPHVALTEIQDRKIYIFDHNSELLKSFPLYGSSIPVVSSGSARYLVSKGDDSEIIVYSF